MDVLKDVITMSRSFQKWWASAFFQDRHLAREAYYAGWIAAKQDKP